MAGFFRHHGIIGYNFFYDDPREINIKLDETTAFIFDDRRILTRTELNQYLNEWPKVGFIRSQTNSHLNIYEPPGTRRPLSHLLTIAKTSKEGKYCLTKRAAEFFVAPNITFDEKWLQSLAEHLQVDDAHSGQAFKLIVKKILLSNSFKERNPTAGKCYDTLDQKADEEYEISCDIRFIVNKNCLSCHKKDSPAGGVNLETWTKLSNNSFGFTITREGKILSSHDANALILESIKTTDPERRMPSLRSMVESEKLRLVKFLEARK